jgi:hypothetical protein
MLGSYPTKTSEAELLDRIGEVAESIAYVPPELADRKRAEIIQTIRRLIREHR